jgi:hypothetical protein
LGNTPIAFANGVTSLAPGESVNAFASYRITQDDICNGKVHNSATAYGNPLYGNPRDLSDDAKATAEATVYIPNPKPIEHCPKPNRDCKSKGRESWEHGGSTQKHRWEKPSDTFSDRRSWSAGSEKPHQALC